jgi:hypothetical protein
MEERANAKIEDQLDCAHYDISELTLVKIPADGNLPYANNLRDFKRLNGCIEIEGTLYNYAKWRLYNDTLEFLCLPNPVTTKLQNAKIDFFKLINDLQSGGQNKKSDPSQKTSKNISSEYYVDTEFSGFFNPCLTISKKSLHISTAIPINFPSSIDYPPEVVC